jgi:hypothetical protein
MEQEQAQEQAQESRKRKFRPEAHATQNSRCELQKTRELVQHVWSRIQGLEFRVWGSGFDAWARHQSTKAAPTRATGSTTARPPCSWISVWGVGFGVWGLGFRIWGAGFRVLENEPLVLARK